MSKISRITNFLRFRDVKFTRRPAFPTSHSPISLPPPPDPHTYYLPVELWIEIVEIVMQDVTPNHKAGDPASIPHPVRNRKSTRAISRSYVTHEDRLGRGQATTNLRLVCRAWSDIVKDICDRHSSYVVVDSPARLIAESNRRIKSLEILDSVGRWDDYGSSLKPYPLQKDLISVARNISTITISRKRSDIPIYREEKGFLPLFIHFAQYFPNVRSLSIEGNIHIPGSLLAGIERGYTQLSSLRISGCSFIGGSIRLPNLKIAEFEIEGPLPRCDFPIVSDISFCSGNRWSNTYVTFFRHHFFNLVSLVDWSINESFSVVPGTYISMNMDTVLPNLCLFGARTSIIQATLPLFPTQSTHPLSHIWIIDSTDRTAKTIRLLLNRYKGLKRLTINSKWITPLSMSYIRGACQKKGIEIVELNAIR